MTAPFTGEDFLKRSLFSSIFGLKVRAPKFHQQGQDNHVHQQNYGNPCNSSDFPSTSKDVPLPTYCTPTPYDYPISSSTATGPELSRERSLSEQLADTLLLASPISYTQEERPVNSPRDIYDEIVEECAQLEQQNGQQQQQQPFDTMSPSYFSECAPCDALVTENAHYGLIQEPAHPTAYGSATYQTVQSPEKCMVPHQNPQPVHQNQLCHCCHSTLQQQLPMITPETANQIMERSIAQKSLFANGVVSLEEFVKLVIAVVKDAGALNKNEKESPEEILRRKRQQNNEAAARYRKRMREAKMSANDELKQLTERNTALREEISTLQQEIDTIKETFSLKAEH